MSQDGTNDIVSTLSAFDGALYMALATIHETKYIADEERVKTLLYVPNAAEDVLLLHVEVQLGLGMKYKVQKLISRHRGAWSLDPIEDALEFSDQIRKLQSGNVSAAKFSSHLREVTAGIIATSREIFPAGQLISVEPRPIPLHEGAPFELGFVVHLLCLAEGGGDGPVVEALCWDVTSLSDWVHALEGEIMENQARLTRLQVENAR